MKVRKMTASAVLTAAALVVFVIEAQIPPPVPVPGVKLGLANVVTVFALYFMDRRAAGSILCVRIVLGSLLLGQASAMIYSFAGGILAFGVASLLKLRIGPEKMWVASVFSAIAHNCGQMAAAVFVTGTPELAWYLPLLIASGIITGAFTGLCAQAVYGRAVKTNLLNKYQKDD